jgi:hypothetical protein
LVFNIGSNGTEKNQISGIISNLYCIRRLQTFLIESGLKTGFSNMEKNDVEAKNLIDLLDLNNYELTRERNRYLERLLDLQGIIGEVGLRDHLLKYPEQYHFASAFETILVMELFLIRKGCYIH